MTRTSATNSDKNCATTQKLCALPESMVLSTDEAQSQTIEALYLYYFPRAVRIAQRLGCSHDDAHDLAQRALRKALVDKRCEHYEGFTGWLKTVIRRDYQNWIKRERRGISLGWYDAAAIVTLDFQPQASSDPYLAVLAKIAREELYQQARLSERECKVCEMRVMDGLPPRDIAAMLGLSTKRVSKILEKIKVKLAPYRPS